MHSCLGHWGHSIIDSFHSCPLGLRGATCRVSGAAVRAHHHPSTVAIGKKNISRPDNGYGNTGKKRRKKYLCSSCQPFTCINEVSQPPSTLKIFKTFPDVFLAPQRGDMGRGRATQQVTKQGAWGRGSLVPSGLSHTGSNGTEWVQGNHTGSCGQHAPGSPILQIPWEPHLQSKASRRASVQHSPRSVPPLPTDGHTEMRGWPWMVSRPQGC